MRRTKIKAFWCLFLWFDYQSAAHDKWRPKCDALSSRIWITDEPWKLFAVMKEKCFEITIKKIIYRDYTVLTMQESQLLLDRKRFTAVYRNVMRSFLVQISYYRPPSKFLKGNVFSHVCLYVHRASPHMTTTWTCSNLFTWGHPRALALALLTPHTGTPPPGDQLQRGCWSLTEKASWFIDVWFCSSYK